VRSRTEEGGVALPFPLDGPRSDRFLCRVKLYKETPATRSKDYSGIGILVSNLLVIVLAVVEGWSLGSMMVIYWVQSVIIGIFHVFRMLLLRSFCTEGFTSNGQRVPEDAKGKRGTAVFFAIHYGFFHLIYGFFLIVGAATGIGDGETPAPEPAQGAGWFDGPVWFVISILGFVVGHGYSFYQNVKADLENRPNLGVMMFLPYARILPMHLTIVLGGMAGASLASMLLFSGLKTAADYLMHIVEHRVLQKKHEKKS
jgi:hypothetical protein